MIDKNRLPVEVSMQGCVLQGLRFDEYVGWFVGDSPDLTGSDKAGEVFSMG